MASFSFIPASGFKRPSRMHDALLGSLETAQDKESAVRPENHT